jgi:molecular chaperone HtpG
MQTDQKDIYYITGDSLTALVNSPHLEALKEKDIEVLLMTDPVDEWVIRDLHEFEKKTFKSAEKGDLDLGKADDKKKEDYGSLFEFLKSSLSEQVKDVKLSTHLKNSAACLAGDAYDMSAYMEKILKAGGQDVPQSKRVLELNMDHPLLAKVRGIFETNKEDEALKDYAMFLYDLAVVSEGGKLDDPARFNRMIGSLV